jgi:hypothetical protein
MWITRERLALLLATMAIACSCAAPAAWAATATTPTTTTTATATTTTPAKSVSAGEDKRGLAVGVLVFGLLVILMLFGYLAWAEDRYFNFAKSFLRRTGRAPPTRDVPARLLLTTLLETKAGTASLVIDMPHALTVGEEQPAHAKLGDKAVVAKWTVDPSTGLTIDPAEGETVKVKAEEAGTYKVTATAAGHSITAPVTVAEAENGGDRGGVPFVGAGYGTILIAIVLIVAATVLGLLDILDSQALATLFGALAGYVFVKGASGGGDAGAAGGKPAASK